METTIQDIPYYRGSNPEEGLSDFYFLIYTSNPTKDTVRIWVDGDKLRMTLKRDKFYDIIKRLIDFETSAAVHETCTTYGCFFQLDRIKKSIKKLHPTSERFFLNPAADFRAANEKLLKEKQDLGPQYQKSLVNWIDQGIHECPYIGRHKQDTNRKENRLV